MGQCPKVACVPKQHNNKKNNTILLHLMIPCANFHSKENSLALSEQIRGILDVHNVA